MKIDVSNLPRSQSPKLRVGFLRSVGDDVLLAKKTAWEVLGRPNVYRSENPGELCMDMDFPTDRNLCDIVIDLQSEFSSCGRCSDLIVRQLEQPQSVKNYRADVVAYIAVER